MIFFKIKYSRCQVQRDEGAHDGGRVTKDDNFMSVPIGTSIPYGKTKRRNNEGIFDGGRDLQKSMWSSFLSADFVQPAMKREADARGGQGNGNGLALSITDNLDTLRRYMSF